MLAMVMHPSGDIGQEDAHAAPPLVRTCLGCIHVMASNTRCAALEVLSAEDLTLNDNQATPAARRHVN